MTRGEERGGKVAVAAAEGPRPIVGFVGLGLMGKPMARNLLRAGYRVVVKSRRPEPEIELEAEGAERASNLAEVGLRSDVVVTMLPNSPDVEAVVLGTKSPEGSNSLVTGLTCLSRPEGGDGSRMVIDMSTISPEVSRSIGERLAEYGIQYLEAPVSGGDVGAIKGTLAIMAGGPEAAFELARPIFDVLGKSATLMGGWGAGQTTKLANNVIAAITIQSVCEGAVLAARSGVDPLRMLEAIRGGAAACWSLEHKIPKIVARDFAPGFMCRLHLKDLDLALEAAASRGMELPLTRRVRDMFAALVEEGLGHEDNCALVRLVERLADESRATA